MDPNVKIPTADVIQELAAHSNGQIATAHVDWNRLYDRSIVDDLLVKVQLSKEYVDILRELALTMAEPLGTYKAEIVGTTGQINYSGQFGCTYSFQVQHCLSEPFHITDVGMKLLPATSVIPGGVVNFLATRMTPVGDPYVALSSGMVGWVYSRWTETREIKIGKEMDSALRRILKHYHGKCVSN